MNDPGDVESVFLERNDQIEYLEYPGHLLNALPSSAVSITADPVEIGMTQIEAARTGPRLTFAPKRKSRLEPGEFIHLGFE